MSRLQISVTFRMSRFRKALLDSALETLEKSSNFAALEWGYDELIRFPYEREKVLNAFFLEDPTESILLLKKSMSKYYSLVFAPKGELGKFEINHEGKLGKKDLVDGFELGGRLASIFKSDFAFVHWAGEITGPGGGALNGALKKRARKFAYSTEFSQAELRECGPRSFYARNWLAGEFLQRFKANVFEEHGCTISQNVWGGIQVDLVPEPWNADQRKLMEAQESINGAFSKLGLMGDYSNSLNIRPGKEWMPLQS